MNTTPPRTRISDRTLALCIGTLVAMLWTGAIVAGLATRAAERYAEALHAAGTSGSAGTVRGDCPGIGGRDE